LAGKRAGSASLRESALHVKNTIMGGEMSAGQSIQFVDLGILMEGSTAIDLLKCDIEGAELLFLQNYEDLLDKVQSAVFELHHEVCDTKKCSDILRGRGFQETVLRATTSFSVTFAARG
jgi:hypothetical protein